MHVRTSHLHLNFNKRHFRTNISECTKFTVDCSSLNKAETNSVSFPEQHCDFSLLKYIFKVDVFSLSSGRTQRSQTSGFKLTETSILDEIKKSHNYS